MKKAFSVALVLFGLVFVGGGAYGLHQGMDARQQVASELGAQHIRTPEDAAIANVPVRDAATARAMADIIDVHARRATGGRSFAEVGRFLAKNGDPAGTSVEAEAVRGNDGQPVRNPLRTVAFEASAARTGLFTSVMAFKVSDLVVGLGAMTLVLGVSMVGTGLALGELTVSLPLRRSRVARPALLGA